MNSLVKYSFKLLFFLLLLTNTAKTKAQVVQYCRQNIPINNPDELKLVPNISSNHHLLIFSKDENPRIYIYKQQLELILNGTLPFKFLAGTQLSIIPFENYYYILLHVMHNKQYRLYKIDGNGNCVDLTDTFQKLLASQLANVKLGFQLIPYQKHLWMVYHTDLDNLEKNTVVMVQTDSLLQTIFAHKVIYDFKRDEEKQLQEILVFGKYIMVLKSLKSGSSLELMKVNLATGYTIRNTFTSSGYIYSQAKFSYNEIDTTVTVSAMLTEPGYSYKPKQYIFISRMNKILVEQVPFVLLKNQFTKNTNTNFLLVDEKSRWMGFKQGRGYSQFTTQERPITMYQDVTMATGVDENTVTTNNLIAQMSSSNSASSYSDDVGVRFSLLDKRFNIINDSLVANTKDAYTIKADEYISFETKGKAYLLIAQQFARRKNGLLLVNTNHEHRLAYTFVRVFEKNKYLLAKARNVPELGMFVPYIRKNEAGFIKISLK